MTANHGNGIINIIDKRTENERTVILKTYETWNKTHLSVVGT